MQELTARCFSPPSPSGSESTTVQAPQSPSAQPSLVPVRPLVAAQIFEHRQRRRHAVERALFVAEEKADRHQLPR